MLDAIWREFLGASLDGTIGGPLELTVSQYALTDQRIVRRQTARVTRALAAAGVLDPP